MKKTLIALAVAASAAVSGSAMAWTQNGTGGSVDLGGTLTPVEKVTPWEVKVGAAVNGLDGAIQKGQKEVSIAVNKSIPVLGIRAASIDGFKGTNGITPQVDFSGKFDFRNTTQGSGKLSLVVNDLAGNSIGKLETSLKTAAQAANGAGGSNWLYASSAGYGFFGGISATADGVNTAGYGFAASMFGDIHETWAPGTQLSKTPAQYVFNSVNHTYNAYYASGIEQGQTIKITLDQAASGDAPIQWKASLPVTVSYQ